MRKSKPRWMFVLGLFVFALAAAPGAVWMALSYQPEPHPAMVSLPPEQRRVEARKFVAQSLQLRNDIINEPTWVASFTDQEVNSWLAEDLVTEFADQIPAGVHNPRVAFEPDRIILAFGLDDGPFRSQILIEARARVPEENVLALYLDKLHAGIVPIPIEQLLDRITAEAQCHGLQIEWTREDNVPVALIRYRADMQRRDVVLERLQLRNGQLQLSGRSQRTQGAATLSLPNRRVLQSTFRKQKPQSVPLGPVSLHQRVTTPAS